MADSQFVKHQVDVKYQEQVEMSEFKYLILALFFYALSRRLKREATDSLCIILGTPVIDRI
jgi:hypothetical protein